MRSMQFFMASVVVACLTVSPALAKEKTPAYYCTSDAYCEKTFSGTVCISVDNYGTTIRKCTPNTKERPACRGGQPGLCPSYQSPETDYLNTQCVFVAKDVDTTGTTTATSAASDVSSSSAAKETSSSSGSGSGRRRLMFEATSDSGSASTTASSGSSPAASSGSSSGTVTTSSSSGSGVASESGSGTSTGSGEDDYATVTIKGKTVTGQFMCVDVSDCENKAYDTSTCLPTTCGSSGSLDQCNNQGTCTYASIQTMSKRSCACYLGFDGQKCEKTISGECDVDCGIGGDCVDHECVCKKGWDGKAYNGKQGKANNRCTKCTNDLACQNDNPCDTESGACVCDPGYSGVTCGATEDSCTKKDCGIGGCQLEANGSAACYCPLCDPNCTLCTTSDCSECPSEASSVQFSKMVVLASFVIAMALSSLFP